jgi:hypothetical protein
MRILLILAGMSLALAAWPQEIYRWVDSNGVVHYSDQPGSPDAQLIQVIDPNTYVEEESPDAGGGATGGGAGEQEPQESSYGSLTIVQPQADQVFFGAGVTVAIAAELDAALQSDHTLVFFVDGQRRPAEGGLAATLTNLERGSHFLRASVLDRNGRPIITSPQITFHVRQPSINTPQSPQRPRPATPPAAPPP